MNVVDKESKVQVMETSNVRAWQHSFRSFFRATIFLSSAMVGFLRRALFIAHPLTTT